MFQQVALRVFGGNGYGGAIATQQQPNSVSTPMSTNTCILWREHWKTSFSGVGKTDSAYETLMAAHLGLRKLLRELQALNAKLVAVSIYVDNGKAIELLSGSVPSHYNSEYVLARLVQHCMSSFASSDVVFVDARHQLASEFVIQHQIAQKPATQLKERPINTIPVSVNKTHAMHATLLDASSGPLQAVRVVHNFNCGVPSCCVVVDAQFLAASDEYKDALYSLLDPSPFRMAEVGQFKMPILGVLSQPLHLKIQYNKECEPFQTTIRDAVVAEQMPFEMFIPYDHLALYQEKSSQVWNEENASFGVGDLHSRYHSHKYWT